MGIENCCRQLFVLRWKKFLLAYIIPKLLAFLAFYTNSKIEGNVFDDEGLFLFLLLPLLSRDKEEGKEEGEAFLRN